MARVTNKAILAERHQPDQPELLDDSQLPVCLPVLEAVRAKRYEFTGVRLVEDDAKALRLVELLLSRWGVKKISRDMHISPHTVRAARRELTRQGKIAPYVQRVVESMEDAIEEGINNYRDALEDGRINPTQIPVGMGIIFDKRQLAMGQATSISTRIEAGDDLKVEAINAYLEKLPKAGTIDPASTEIRTNPRQMPCISGQDVTLDAIHTQPDGPADPELGQPSSRMDGDLPAAAPEPEPAMADGSVAARPGGGGGGGGGGNQ